MKYKELQQKLKRYQAAGLMNIRLNAQRQMLELEYQRCLQLGLSQQELEQRIRSFSCQEINQIQPFYLYTYPDKFTLKIIKAKTYQLAQVNNLQDLKLEFPLVKNYEFDFRTKKAWSECVYLVDRLTLDSQDFLKFKQQVKSLIGSIEQQQYHFLTGESAVEEAYDDLANYISWWKGAQWEYALSQGTSPLDHLKRSWLENFLPRHNLAQLLNYSPSD